LLPVCFIGLLVIIKNAAENSPSFDRQTVEATFEASSFAPLTFTDYVTALRSQKICTSRGQISGLDRSNWQVPLVKCDSRQCNSGNTGQDASQSFCSYPIIAVAGINGGDARAVVFKGWVERNYPAIVDPNEMPFDYELIQLFQSPQEMDNYVTAKDYDDGSKPKIAMGIVFDGSAANEWNYWLRQNSTNFNAPEEEGRPATRTTPDTSTATDSFARTDQDVCVPEGGTPNQGPFQNSCTGQYLYVCLFVCVFVLCGRWLY